MENITENHIYSLTAYVQEYQVFDSKIHFLKKKKFEKLIAARLSSENSDSKVNISKYIDDMPEEMSDILTEQIERENLLEDQISEIVSEKVHNIQYKYLLYPILLNDGTGIDVTLYVYRDGRHILKFTYKINENDVSGYFQITKNATNIVIYKEILMDEKKTKSIGEKFVKIFDSDINTILGKYKTYIHSLIGNKQEMVVDFKVLNIININGGETKNYKLLLALSKAPVRLNQIKDQDLEKGFVNIVEYIGAFVNPNKFVAYNEQGNIEKLMKLNKIEVDREPFFSDIVITANCWPMLEHILLKRHRMLPNLTLSLNRSNDNKIYQYYRKKMYQEKVETFTMSANMHSVVESIPKLQERMISEVMYEQYTSLNRNLLNLIQLKRNMNSKKMNEFLSVFSFLFSILFSYEPIAKTTKIFFQGDYSKIIYIGFNVFLFVVIFLGWIRNKLISRSG